ncbi:MAG TPA: FAD-linked oxidase C-terminal domain-containing protein [Gemmataceae bacterium]|nr:FAD-linked oxidase C-terminal domain-containing protein [Gemmataceae bacterium]
MSVAELPLIHRPSGLAGAPVDVAGLRAALADIQGEVRFDRLARALYSTDASVYQLVPLGVVLPKTEEDIVTTLRACARFGVPITARGGGTSQAGQAIGPGIVLDCSKYLNRVLEVNAAERWVRVQPGCVLDDLNLHLKPLGLQFAPDISTSNRATIGGMLANNSSGTHSLIHGKTIDHVLEIRALLSDGSVVHCGPLSAAALEAKCAQGDREGECYRVVRRLAAEHADEIERRYPKLLRRVGGYNLDRFTPSGFNREPPHPQPLSPWKGERGEKPALLSHTEEKGGKLAPLSPLEGERGRGEGGSQLNGFNLAHLLVGSEGTLAITLEAKLRLVELPRAKALLVIQFADLLESLAATPVILRHGPAAVEVIDKYVLDSTRLNPEASRLRDFLQGDPGAILIVEFYGDRPDELPPRLAALEAELRQRGFGYHYLPATDAALQARVWKLRKLALGLSMAEKGDAKAISFVEDTAVSPEHLRDYIAEFLQVIARHGTTAGVYAHASVGCLHVRPVINLKTEAGIRQFESIAAEVAELVLKYGGALSGEHGDGLVRSPFQEKMFGPVLYAAFREIKRTFDPQNLLNPGKIVDAPPLSQNLRYGPAYVTPEVPTTFDFSADGGLVRAAELCAGVGECRKKRDGVMCPSYQATRDEQHCTRGRANALRLALTGQVGLQGLTDPALMEVLDLCLECKACKSECPTNVDMARLKAEFLHQYYQKHGLPWRNRVFGNVARLSKWGCRLAPVSNWLVRSRLGRWLNEKLLGIDRRRVPPAFARETLVRRYLRWWLESKPLIAETEQRVLLLADTFANYHEPQVGMAAVEVLYRLGAYPSLAYPGKTVAQRMDIMLGGLADLGFNLDRDAVGVVRGASGLVCCGRPFISNGLLAQAVAHACRNVELLYPYAEAGTPIIACEPSCILTIKDDYPALLPGELRRKAEVVAGACRTFEEFAESLLANGSPLKLRPGPKKILVQGHCHQQSLVGMEPTLRLLRRIPGAEVIDLDAGCCGMAGSFGYEKEHYEVSRLVGEQRLFPALRQAGADTVVVAPGFSCRLQIKHFTGRTALHPAELLFSLLDEPPAS